MSGENEFGRRDFSSHSREVSQGRRFEFGRNWRNFLVLIDESRIAAAVQSLKEKLDVNTLAGKTFLDVGTGSGLFSLAARKLGAHVHCFDYDPASAACARELKQRYQPKDDCWTIDEASVLDNQYLATLGQFDVVYAWGVLHQTGDMWQALENVNRVVQDGGRLFLSIYNDQGGASRRWLLVKKLYNRAPTLIRLLVALTIGAWWEMRGALIRLVRFQNPLPFRDWSEKKKDRGMSVWHDLVDWVGGFPFEVAKPEQVFDFYRQRGYILTWLTTDGGGHGCNEYVFLKTSSDKALGGDNLDA